MERLSEKLDRILARIDGPLQTSFVSANDAFLSCIAALEQHLHTLLTTMGNPRPGAGLATLLIHAPVDEADREWLQELRRVRNAVAHHEGVHVTPEFAREAIFGLRRIAAVLDRTEVVAGTIMFPNPTVVHPSDPIARAQGLMLAHDYSQLPVVDEQGALIGLVTDRSILRRLQRERGAADPRQIPVEGALAENAMATLAPDAPLVLVARALQNRSEIRCVVVVVNGRPVGIITPADLLRFRLPHEGDGASAVNAPDLAD